MNFQRYCISLAILFSAYAGAITPGTLAYTIDGNTCSGYADGCSNNIVFSQGVGGLLGESAAATGPDGRIYFAYFVHQRLSGGGFQYLLKLAYQASPKMMLATAPNKPWKVVTVDGAGTPGQVNNYIGYSVSIVENGGLLHLFYSQASDTYLRHATFNPTNGALTYSVLDTVNVANSSVGTSFQISAVNYQGNLHVFYSQTTSYGWFLLAHMWQYAPNTWAKEILDGDGIGNHYFNNGAVWNVAAVSPSDNSVHVMVTSYRGNWGDSINRHLWFDGGSWHWVTTTLAPVAGADTQLVAYTESGGARFDYFAFTGTQATWYNTFMGVWNANAQSMVNTPLDSTYTPGRNGSVGAASYINYAYQPRRTYIGYCYFDTNTGPLYGVLYEKSHKSSTDLTGSTPIPVINYSVSSTTTESCDGTGVVGVADPDPAGGWGRYYFYVDRHNVDSQNGDYQLRVIRQIF